MSALLRLLITPKIPALRPAQLLAEGFHELLRADLALKRRHSLSPSRCQPVWRQIREKRFVSARSHPMLKSEVFYGYGLSGFGFPSDKLLMVSAAKEKHLLWTLEEALASKAFGAVIGALGGAERLYGFPESRRLKLRTLESGTPLYLLRHHSQGGATAAHGRWRIVPAPSRTAGTHAGFELPGAPRLRLTLEKLSGFPPQQWEMEYGTRGFRMAAVLPDRADRTEDGWRQAG